MHTYIDEGVFNFIGSVQTGNIHSKLVRAITEPFLPKALHVVTGCDFPGQTLDTQILQRPRFLTIQAPYRILLKDRVKKDTLTPLDNSPKDSGVILSLMLENGYHH
jgi:hypothetical protein